MNEERVVLDANIAFRALSRGRNDLVAMLRPAGRLAGSTLHAPRFLFVELFKHKERIVRASRLLEAEVIESLHALVARVEFHNEALITIGHWMEAYRLCSPTDEKDTAYVALALHLDAKFLERRRGIEGRSADARVRPISVRAHVSVAGAGLFARPRVVVLNRRTSPETSGSVESEN